MKYKYKILKEKEFYNFNSANGKVFEFEDGIQLGIANGESLEDGCCLCGIDDSAGWCIQSNISSKKNIYQCNSCICENCIRKIIKLFQDQKLFFLQKENNVTKT